MLPGESTWWQYADAAWSQSLARVDCVVSRARGLALAAALGAGGGARFATVRVQARADAPQFTRGLSAFVRAYAAARGDAAGGGALADGWESPQTSVMLVDVRWARETLGAFWRAVDATGCVYDNRWGDLLVESAPGYPEPWDGTYQGDPLPIGTYYYVIRVNEPEFPDPLTGPVTILR